jgi:hypothetical protein
MAIAIIIAIFIAACERAAYCLYKMQNPTVRTTHLLQRTGWGHQEVQRMACMYPAMWLAWFGGMTHRRSYSCPSLHAPPLLLLLLLLPMECVSCD